MSTDITASKIEKIERALTNKILSLDDSFVTTCHQRIMNTRNLDRVLDDISHYYTSNRGIRFAECSAMLEEISSWPNWRFVTLTFRPGWCKWKNVVIGNAIEHKAREARHNVKVFQEQLSRSMFSRSSIKKKGVRVRHISKMGGDSKLINIHYHSIIELPTEICTDEFDANVSRLWVHGGTDCRRYNDNLKETCLYLLKNEAESNSIGHPFDFSTLRTFKKAS